MRLESGHHDDLRPDLDRLFGPARVLPLPRELAARLPEGSVVWAVDRRGLLAQLVAAEKAADELITVDRGQIVQCGSDEELVTAEDCAYACPTPPGAARSDSGPTNDLAVTRRVTARSRGLPKS